MTVTFPPLPTTARTPVGGRYKPLSSNIQGYSQEDVENRMRSGAAVAQPRFELLDTLGNVVQPGLEGVLAAKVDYDETREIPGSLELTLLPDERLRNAPLQYRVKAYVGIGPMQDGGRAEFPIGVYVWTRPKRDVYGTTGLAETWTITMGDQIHYFQVAGVGPTPFIVSAGDNLVVHIYQILGLAGIADPTDYTGIAWSELPAATTAYYTWQTAAKFTGVDRETGTPTNQAAGPMNLLAIEKELHDGLGYAPPKFNPDGVYISQPDRDWANDPPDVMYDTEQDGVVLIPAQTEPDFTQVANRVGGWTSNPEAGSVQFDQPSNFYQAIVDLNDILPGHPIAQVNARHYLDQTLPSLLAPSDEVVYQACRVDLMRRLSYYEKLTLKRVGFLAVHDPPGILGVRIDRDPELGLTTFTQNQFTDPHTHSVDLFRLYREVGYTLDLFTLEAESHLTGLRRVQFGS